MSGKSFFKIHFITIFLPLLTAGCFDFFRDSNRNGLSLSIGSMISDGANRDQRIIANEDQDLNGTLLSPKEYAFGYRVQVQSLPTTGQMDMLETSSWNYAPSENFVGEATLQYEILLDGRTVTNAALTLEFTPINDSPSITQIIGSLLPEGATVPLTAMTASDPDDIDEEVFIRVMTVPLHGDLRLNNQPLTVMGTVSLAQFKQGLLHYHHNGSENFTDAFAFALEDGAGASVQGLYPLVILPSNDAPILVNNLPISLMQGQSKMITANELKAIDADHVPSQLIFLVVISPTQGFLKRSGMNLLAGSTFTQVDINNGLITYQHNGFGGQIDFFAFTVLDTQGASAPTAYFSISITAPDVERVVKISAGLDTTCAVTNTGRARCIGRGDLGALGSNSPLIQGPFGAGMEALADIALPLPIKDIVTRAYHTCAILMDNTLRCWGFGGHGQLGLAGGETPILGDESGEVTANLPAINLGDNFTIAELSLGLLFTCVRSQLGVVKCFGHNSDGQLGQGDTEDRGDALNEMGNQLLPINIGTGRSAIAIASGEAHVCALRNTQDVVCWGSNNFGQLGRGDNQNRGDGANEMGDQLIAVDLGTGRTALQITAGAHHSCALLDNKEVKCWGANFSGQLGLGDEDNRGDQSNELGDQLSAVALPNGKFALSIHAGAYHNCILGNDQKLYCFGDNNLGQLGLGHTAPIGNASNQMGNFLQPVQLPGFFTPHVISTGWFHNAILGNFTEVRTWGLNSFGQLGDPIIGSRADEPFEMLLNMPLIDLF